MTKTDPCGFDLTIWAKLIDSMSVAEEIAALSEDILLCGLRQSDVQRRSSALSLDAHTRIELVLITRSGRPTTCLETQGLDCPMEFRIEYIHFRSHPTIEERA